MSVAVKKIDGVESVRVTLETGLVEIRLKDGNEATIEQVRKLIRDNGFTPKGAEVALSGTVVKDKEQIGVSVRGTGVVYRVTGLPEAEGVIENLSKSVGRDVSVVGLVPASGKDSAEKRPILRIRSFTVETDESSGGDR